MYRPVIITINVSPQVATQGYNSVTLAARTSCAACENIENNAPILILRGLKANTSFAMLWAQVRHYD